jgi:hypothetical protein
LRITPERIAALPEDKRKRGEQILRDLKAQRQTDPLQFFHACPSYCGSPDCHRPKPENPTGGHPRQHAFGAAKTRIQAAFAGNRFGKTTILVAKAYIQHYPVGALPERLERFRVTKADHVVKGRLMCPSDDAFEEYMEPKLRQYAPSHLLVGNSFDKAWSKQFRVLHFKDGGQLKVFTYKQDVGVLVGGDYDYVGYDEPPPRPHRNENLRGLTDRGGFEMYALTPINMTGGGIGWLYREIEKKREAPDITVIHGSIHDNPILDPENVEFVLSQYPEQERQAREFGRFMHMGGLVYDDGFEGCLTKREVAPADIKPWDIVVGIDPGLKNAAFIWGGFDSENRCFIFDEVLLQEKTPKDYADAIRTVNARWGIREPMYVIDPSARNRSLVNAEDVESVLQSQGIFCTYGYNAVEAGVQQVRLRIQNGMLKVSPRCLGLRDEAEEYRMKDREDGEFEVVKENDHRLDALRYLVASRLWAPEHEEGNERRLGWTPGQMPSQAWLEGTREEVGPLGFMS